jgi:anaerobic selenocysteine-containing dehydrogenase
MNSNDMQERGIEEFDLVDVTSFSRDGSQRAVYGYRAVNYELPPGCAAGYMPEMNVLCGIADVSTQSEQPVTKPSLSRSRRPVPIPNDRCHHVSLIIRIRAR